MKLQTQMQKTQILTVENGLCQAQANGVLYQQYTPVLDGYTFAGDAKKIFEAMNLMNPGFKVFKEAGQLLFVDDKQEIRISEMLPDKIAEPPTEFNKDGIEDLIYRLKALRPFTTPDFPGWFFKDGIIEALHPSMIVRSMNTTEVRGAFSIDILPSACGGYHVDEKGLWLKYANGVVCLGRLDIEAPDTSSFFKNSPQMQPIPEIIKERWVACETVRWDKSELCLLPHSRIENVQGSGEYDGKLFHKIIKNANYWAFDTNLLHFAGTHIIGVLENQEVMT